MSSTPPDAVTLLSDFAGQHPAYSPNPLWWWSGDTVTEERIRFQLERFREGGIWNLTIINLAPTGPLYGNFADDPPMMSDRWWDLFRCACETARELGMHIWFYDQIGFSGANFQGQIIARTPRHAGQTIERVMCDTHGSASLVCPPGGTPLLATVRPLDADGQPTGSPKAVAIERLAAWEGATPVRLSIVYAAERGFDYTSPEACLALLDAIHGEFERHVGEFFGNVIPGSFQDELPPMPRWGATFADTFRELHGYDLIPHLDALWDATGGDERRIRHDYHTTRAHLAEQAFFKPLHNWHAQRGMIVGVDQQNPARAGDPIGTVDLYADYMRTHRWFSAPGSDHHGEAKLHSSLAHLHGNERVWIESFHSSGWGGTLEETFDWLVPWLRAGANLYNPHATYFGTRGGWFEWAPPSTDWRQPYWRHYSVFADAVARLCWLLTRGRHEADVAVLFPTATVQSGTGLDGAHSEEAAHAHDTYLDLVGRMVWFEARTGILDAAGIDYDILDDDSIARGKIDHSGIKIGDETYRVIILPACTDIEERTARALSRFAHKGGIIYAIDTLPTRITNGMEHLLPQLTRYLRLVDRERLGTMIASDEPLVTASAPTLVRRIGDATVVFAPSAIPMASEIHGWPLAAIDFDRTRYLQEHTIRVRSVSGSPTIWDPFTGRAEALADDAWRDDGAGVTVALPADGAPCTVLVWGAPEVADRHRSACREIATLPETWQIDLVPTLDNRWGDFTWPASTGAFPVQQWTLDLGEATAAIATFGPRGRWLGPGNPTELVAATPDASWEVASWSLSRGIHKDPLYPGQLGASGHVAEEFVDFGKTPREEAVRFRTVAPVPEPGFVGWLVLGAAAAVELRIDDAPVTIPASETSRYQKAIPVELAAGEHAIDLLLTSRVSGRGRLRLSLALVTDLATMRRPDQLTIDESLALGPWVGFATRFTTNASAASALMQIGTRGPATVLIDGQDVARQGGYLPYGDGSSTQRYDFTAYLAEPGEHTFEIRIDQTGDPMIATVDGVIAFGDGSPDLWLMTDSGWTATSDGRELPLAIESQPPGDPALLNLRQRPHPLPASRWLEGDAADPGTVLPTVWTDEFAAEAVAIRLTVPPGSTGVTIPVAGAARATLAGHDLGSTSVPGDWTLDLAEATGSELIIVIDSAAGNRGGAALTGPIVWHTGPGNAPLGQLSELGLGDYSGIVVYRQRVNLPAAHDGSPLWLDLGDLRGSVAVRINGEPAGIHVVAPFRVEITGQIRVGATGFDVEIEFANTLGPYMQATSPTPFVLAGQDVSGLFGPVRLLSI